MTMIIFREKAHGMTKTDELIYKLVQDAEENFFKSIQQYWEFQEPLI